MSLTSIVGSVTNAFRHAVKLIHPTRRSSRKRSARRPSRRLEVEQFESRELLSANPVLMVIANQDFYYREYGDTRAALLQAGQSVVVAAATRTLATPHANSGQGSDGGFVMPDIALTDANASNYSAIVFVGGWGASEYQFAFSGTYDNPAYHSSQAVKDAANRLISDFILQDKYVTAICHGVSVLAWSRVGGQSLLQGRSVSAYDVLSPAFTLDGTHYQNLRETWHETTNGATVFSTASIGDPNTSTDDVYVDPTAKIITAENWDSATRFGQVIAQRLNEVPPVPPPVPPVPPPVPPTPRGDIIVTGADADGAPHVRVRDAAGGAERFSFFAYDPAFGGGVRVATGDVNADGTPDIITAAGPGGGPHIRVFDGTTGTQLAGPIGSFFAYDPSFTGGMWIAAGDVNGDGYCDVITGADAGGGPHVRVFSGRDGSGLANFFAYAPTFTGGVRVAAGDMNGDGRADIFTAPGVGGGPHVKVFSGEPGALATGAPPAELANFFAYDPAFTAGLYIAAGDVNGDSRADILTGAGASGGPHVRAFSGLDRSEVASFFAYDPSFRGGVRVGATDINGDGRADILTSAGPGGGPHIRILDGMTVAELDSFFAYDPAFQGGVFIGGSRRR